MSASGSGRFSVIPARAVDDKKLGKAALLVLVALGTYSDRDGWCWPSQTTIANRLGVSRPAVANQIKKLKQLGYIQIEPRFDSDGRQVSSKYRVLYDGEANNNEGGVIKLGDTPVMPEVTPPVTPEVTGGVIKLGDTNDPINDPINDPLGASSKPPFDVAAYKERIRQAVITFQRNGKKHDLSKFPEDARSVIEKFISLWPVDPPRKSKGSNSEFAYWIKGAREINNACGEFGIDLMYLYADTYNQRRNENGGRAPHTVSGPSSLVKVLRGFAAELRTEVNEEKVIVI